MRILPFVVAALVLAGCNGSGLTSSVDGVYSGGIAFHSANPGAPPASSQPLAGAVAPDGNGYFISTGVSFNSDFLHFTNLWQPGPERIGFDTAGPDGHLVPVNVKPVAGGGYKFFFDFSGVDTSQTYSFVSDPITNQPRAMAELAGSYQGFDILESQPQQVTGTLDKTGKLAANGDTCDIAGQLSQVDDKNLYTVTLQFSGGTGCDLTMNGVAWISDTDLTGTSTNKGTNLNIVAADPTEKFAIAFMLRLL
jgi:hypothetical protein